MPISPCVIPDEVNVVNEVEANEVNEVNEVGAVNGVNEVNEFDWLNEVDWDDEVNDEIDLHMRATNLWLADSNPEDGGLRSYYFERISGHVSDSEEMTELETVLFLTSPN